MNLLKHKPYRNRKMLDAARDMPCIKCGIDNGTICARHYNGSYQHMYGKGRGQKCSDLMTAEFCSECDRDFQEGTIRLWPTDAARNAEFLHWIAMTNIRRIENGWLG